MADFLSLLLVVLQASIPARLFLFAFFYCCCFLLWLYTFSLVFLYKNFFSHRNPEEECNSSCLAWTIWQNCLLWDTHLQSKGNKPFCSLIESRMHSLSSFSTYHLFEFWRISNYSMSVFLLFLKKICSLYCTVSAP